MGGPLTAEPGATRVRAFASEPGAFRETFNRTPFQFAHTLVGHPLFELPRLGRLAETLLHGPGRGVLWKNGQARVGQKWGDYQGHGGEDLAEAIANLDRSGSWVLLYSAQADPEYAALLDGIMTELGELTGRDLAREATWKDAYIFLASPEAVTSYHIDHESTFLFQIHGDRRANIWAPDDRTVLTDPELERYYVGDTAAADYREENQSKAYVYAMTAGTGVHHPSCSPHWFKNGDVYSVAMGVHFCLPDLDRRGRVYQVNHCLRQVGLRPTPPGSSAWKDALKSNALGLLCDRSPKTKNDLIRSGFRRLTSPLRWARGRRSARQTGTSA